jgi:sec-independent protein translocase protein TatA
MFGLGMPELLVVLVIVIIIFGASRLPQLGEGLGKAIKGFKKGIAESQDQDKDKNKPDPKA